MSTLRLKRTLLALGFASVLPLGDARCKNGGMPDEPLTLTLRAAHAGDREAADRAYSDLYPELLKIARARLRVHQSNTLLYTEGLVRESFLRFVAADKLRINDRKYFFTYAAKAMRNIVIDFARRRQAERYGGAADRVTWTRACRTRGSRRHR